MFCGATGHCAKCTDNDNCPIKTEDSEFSCDTKTGMCKVKYIDGGLSGPIIGGIIGGSLVALIIMVIVTVKVVSKKKDPEPSEEEITTALNWIYSEIINENWNIL